MNVLPSRKRRSPRQISWEQILANLDDGVIAAIGSHHDLLAAVPAYRAILSQEMERREEVSR